MAYISQYASGFRVQIELLGVRQSKTFRTKREATAWAAQRETEIRTTATLNEAEKHTLRDALSKYSVEVSPRKKGERWERVRIELFYRLLPVDLKLAEITPRLLSSWRDDRLQSVKPGTVLREFNLLSDVLNTARREWGWIKENPLADVRRPPQPKPRSRVIVWSEIRAMLKVMGYRDGPVRSVSQACACAFLLALRTGMRAGELCNLAWPDVHSDFVKITDGKTGARDVALTRQAARVIDQCRGFDDVLVFGIKSQTLDALFRKYRQKAGLEGFTFHDSRHTAATWLAQKLAVLDLCKMFGWKNPAMAMVYYNPTASDISKRLSARP
jgi:integrase